MDRGHAYRSESGVYFDLNAFGVNNYGRLGEGVQEGEHRRAEGSERGDKRSTADFALWKRGKPGDPTWDSPFGKGRPGWFVM